MSRIVNVYIIEFRNKVQTFSSLPFPIFFSILSPPLLSPPTPSLLVLCLIPCYSLLVQVGGLRAL